MSFYLENRRRIAVQGDRLWTYTSEIFIFVSIIVLSIRFAYHIAWVRLGAVAKDISQSWRWAFWQNTHNFDINSILEQKNKMHNQKLIGYQD